MNKYQESLENLVIASCPTAIKSKKYCNECYFRKICNSTAKGWVDRIQQLVDKETPMKVAEKYIILCGSVHFQCPSCKKLLLYPQQIDKINSQYNPNCCSNCSQKLDWGNEK